MTATTLSLTLLDARDDRAVEEVHDFDLRRWARDEPHDPPPTRQQTLVDATRSWAPGRRETWLAHADGELVGTARLTLYDADNTHLVEAMVIVAPDHRRRGLGRELLAHAASRARADGRRLIIGESPPGTEAAAFAEAVGARCALVEVRRRLSLEDLDQQEGARLLEAAWQRAGGYEVLTWSGPVAEELLAPVAEVMQSMNDAPTDELDYQDEVWTPARYRSGESYKTERGDRWHVTVARHRRTGELAGLTEVVVRGDGHPQGYQADTCVVPGHRGHALGLVLKLEMLRELRRLEPTVRAIDTWNAASNTHMIAINEQMGYRVLRTEAEWQLEVDAVPVR